MRFPCFRKLTADRRGATALMVAVMAAMLIGFTSLGVEVVLALDTQRQMQSAADSAALGAATAMIAGYPDPAQQGFAIAKQAGFSTGQTSSFPSSGSPTCPSTPPFVYVGWPCDGTHAGDHGYVQVLIEQPFTLRLANVVTTGDFMLHGRATASGFQNLEGCAAILDPSSSSALKVNGGAAPFLGGCDAWVDSSSGSAVSITNGAVPCAHSLNVVGSVSGTIYQAPGSAPCTTTTALTPKTGSIAIPDPYANVAFPTAPATCNNLPNSGTVTAGQCWKNATVNGGKTVSLCPGRHWISGGTLQVNGGGTLNMAVSGCDSNSTGYNGVTILLTGSSPGNVATVNFNGTAIVNLTAPTCGTDGCTINGMPSEMLFFQNRLATTTTCGNTNTFGGGSGSVIRGILYFPTQCVVWGGGSISTSGCFEIISWNLSVSGNPALNATACIFNHARQFGGTAALSE